MTESRRKIISIIIPTLNEEKQLGNILKVLSASIDPERIEIIISDGGSQDCSLDIAANFPCVVVKGSLGRAKQMNRGASQAKGEWLLFLHADSLLPEDWESSILKARKWGFFPVKLSGKHRLLRLIEKSICLRSSITGIATGDQALYFNRNFFENIHGFDEIPIMEDIAISKKARQIAAPSIADQTVITSSRRWERQGILKTVFLMWGLRLAYWFGTSPERLHRIYYPGHCK